MHGNNKLSVCLLGYRHAPYVEECVSSIWAGGHANIEIVALDDGSNDGSIEKLKDLSVISPFPIRILEQENTGDIPGNFNRLLSNADGEYVLFSSMDDMPMPGALGRMMDIALKEESAFVAHANALTLGPDGKTEFEMFAPAFGAASPQELLTKEYEYLHTFYIQGAIFRKDILDAIGGFEAGMLGDDIVLRTKIFSWLMSNPVSFSILEGPGCIYRRHGGNVSKNPVRQVKTAMQYLDRFWPDRPYPEILRQWMLTALEEKPLAETMPAFKFGKKGMEFLKDPEIRERIQEAEKIACK